MKPTNLSRKEGRTLSPVTTGDPRRGQVLVIFAVAIMALVMMGLAWGGDGVGWSLIVVCGLGGAAHWLIVREISQQREDAYRRCERGALIQCESGSRRTTT